MSKTKTTHSMWAAVAVLATTTVSSFAGSTVKDEASKKQPLAAVSGQLSLDAVSGYMFRGQLLDSNMAYQPSLNLSVPFDVSGLGLDGGSVQFSTLQSINQNGPTSGWFRSEVTVGVALTKGLVTVTPAYQFFSSPTNKFAQSQGFNLRVDLDDSKWLNVKPYASAFAGIQGNSSTGDRPGFYYEAGISPSRKIQSTTISLPVNVGFGSGGYFAGDESYGFTSVGLTSVTPITPNLDFNAGVRYWHTSDAMNNGKNSVLCTSVGLSLNF